MGSTGEEFRLNVLVVGGGLGGLGAAISIAQAGHQVTVFESFAQPHQAGAGIQISPNGSRLLRRWGVTDVLKSNAATLGILSFIRYDGSKLLAHRDNYAGELKANYGEISLCSHHIELHKALAQRAMELGVRIIYSAKVSGVDFDRPAITFEDGSVEEGDLIVAADGLWSAMRTQLLGRPLIPKPTGDLAYRVVVTADMVEDDEELKDVMSKPGMRVFLGAGSHVVMYSLGGGRMVNMVLSVPDNLPPEVSKQPGDLEEMMKSFEGWDPLLTKFLSKVQKVDKWKLLTLEVNEPWRSKQGAFVLAGDACHPILPYMAQGTNCAFEDGAALGGLLGKITSKSDIPAATAIDERMRKDRVAKIREETFSQQFNLHLPDGEKQEARDKVLATSFEEQATWTHPPIQPWLYGYDAHLDAEKQWDNRPTATGVH